MLRSVGGYRADGTGDGHGGRAGSHGPFSGGRVLGVGCRGDGDHTVSGCEHACCLVIGVVCAGSEGGAVQSHADIGQQGIKGIGDRGVVGLKHGGIAAVEQLEGVGQLAVLGDGDRGNRLDHAQLSRVSDGDGFLSGHGGNARTLDGDGVGDRAAGLHRRKAVEGRRVDDGHVAVRGYGDIAEDKPVGRCDSRIGLQNAVSIILQRVLDIIHRLNGAGTEGVGAEVVADRQPVDRAIGVVDDAHDIGQGVALAVGLVDRVLGHAEDLFDHTDGDIGLHLSPVIAERRHIRKCCSHGFSFP